MKKKSIIVSLFLMFFALCMNVSANGGIKLSGVVNEVYIVDGMGDKVQCLVLKLDEKQTFNVYDDYGDKVDVTTDEVQLMAKNYTSEMNGTRVTAEGSDIFQGLSFYNIRPLTMSNAILTPAVNVQSEKEISVIINGETITFDQPPIIKNDRTFVPIRTICEKLGAEVTWVADEKRADISSPDGNISLYIGYAVPRINGVSTIIDAAPFIENGRTLVPIRVISQTLGSSVDWDGENRSITIAKVQKPDISTYSEYLLDSGKAIVYDAPYGGEFKTPYINLKSAAKINDEIKSAYDEYEQYAYETSYTYSINNNVLSLVYSIMMEEELYFCFNIDITNSEKLSFNRICEMTGLSENDFINTVNLRCVSAFDSMFDKSKIGLEPENGGVPEKFYKEQRAAAEKCFNNSSQWFIGSDKTVNALICMPSLYGGDYYYAVNTGIMIK